MHGTLALLLAVSAVTADTKVNKAKVHKAQPAPAAAHAPAQLPAPRPSKLPPVAHGGEVVGPDYIGPDYGPAGPQEPLPHHLKPLAPIPGPSIWYHGLGNHMAQVWRAKTPGNIAPRVWYLNEGHGYYYFRPYNYTHVAVHQDFAAKWGQDPRNPYSNEFFQTIYDQVESQWHPEDGPPREPEMLPPVNGSAPAADLSPPAPEATPSSPAPTLPAPSPENKSSLNMGNRLRFMTPVSHSR